VIANGAKQGVPLSDVWDIPYLNPKATERVGYPTQKPILLLERIIQLCTDEGDWVLDPFCGSGTTLVAAKLLGRNSVGVDVSSEAIEMTRQRLDNLQKTESALLAKGRSQYRRKDIEALECLNGLDYFVVQRNRGIDALLKHQIEGKSVFIRIQKPEETPQEAALALWKATRDKGQVALVVVVIEENALAFLLDPIQEVHFVRSAALQVKDVLKQLVEQSVLSH